MEIERIFVGALHTDCYLLKTPTEAAVIDPGAEAEKILQHIGQRTVEKIVLTHGHFDHMLAAEELKQKTGAKLYISKEDAEMLESPEKSLYAEFSTSKEDFPKTSCDGYLKDEIVLCGTRFEVIETPGHSKGSVSLWWDKELFSGDTLFRESIGRYDRGCYNDIMHSLWKLMLLDDDVRVHPGHGFSTTIGSERQNNPFLR